MDREAIPRLPVFGWNALGGRREPASACLLSLPRVQYTTSGRASILLALEVLGVEPGDQVLLPSYHCPTMVAPAASLNAVPRFYPLTVQGAPDLAWLSQQDMSGVRVMLTAHYFGLPQPMSDIRNWCTTRGIALIEDCAHALFGRADGRPVGSWGDVAIASLTKFLPVPEGGCLVMNTDRTMPALQACPAAAHLRAGIDILEVGAAQQGLGGLNTLVNAGLAAVRGLRGGGASLPSRNAILDAVSVGAEASGNELCIDADMAHRRLSAPSRWVARALPRERIEQNRRRNYELLVRQFAETPGLRPLRPELPPDCAPYVFPLWVDRPDPGYIELLRLFVPVFRWDRLWPGMPDLPDDQGRLWSNHVLQLACHQDLTPADLSGMACQVLQTYRGR